MGDARSLLYEVADGIVTITVNRPDRMNALDRASILELGEALRRAREDDAVRGILVTGSGPKAFVAGADIAELERMTPVEGVEVSRLGQRVFRELELSRKPVVAAVNGFALGGGCELALACHLRVASEGARFGLPEVKLGLLPGYGGTMRLPRLVGRGRALELILTGAMIDAAEAYRIGLVNRVVPAESLLEQSRALLSSVLANGPVAVAAALEAVTRATDLSADDGLALESTLFGFLAGTADMREGTRAFLEKRGAEFRGE